MQGKSGKFDKVWWYILIYPSWVNQINQKGGNSLSEAHVLSNLKLNFTTTRSSTFSEFNLALFGVTTLPVTENTCSDLDEAVGTGKTTLTSLVRKGNLGALANLMTKAELEMMNI